MLILRQFQLAIRDIVRNLSEVYMYDTMHKPIKCLKRKIDNA